MEQALVGNPRHCTKDVVGREYATYSYHILPCRATITFHESFAASSDDFIMWVSFSFVWQLRYICGFRCFGADYFLSPMQDINLSINIHTCHC